MDEETKLAEALATIRRALSLCDELTLPLAANYIQLGLDIVEDRATPGRLYELPTDLPVSD